MSMLVNPYVFGSGATPSSIVAGSAPTSDQWRERYPLGDLGWGYISACELAGRATSGGANQFTGGTASTNGNASTVGNAFDGVLSSFWNSLLSPNSPATVGQYIQYTTPSPISIVEWYHRGDQTGSGGVNPEQIIVEYYSTAGGGWAAAYTSPVYTTSDWPGTTPEKTFAFVAPTYTVAPSISYTFLAVGDTLTGNVGTYSNAAVVTYQWKRNGAAIGGATSTTYTLVSADIGAQITFAVYIENGAGAYTGTSASVGPIISAASYATQSVEFSDTSTVTLSDSSTLEMYNRTA